MATDCLVAATSTSSNDLNNNVDEGVDQNANQQDDDKWETVYNHRDKQKLKSSQKHNGTHNNNNNNNNKSFKSSKKDRNDAHNKTDTTTTTPANNDATSTMTTTTTNENIAVNNTSDTQQAPSSPKQKPDAPPAPLPKHNPWAKIPDVKPIKLKGKFSHQTTKASTQGVSLNLCLFWFFKRIITTIVVTRHRWVNPIWIYRSVLNCQ